MHLESISTRVSPLFRCPGLQARVESAFAEAVNLVTTHGAALALVSQRVGNGPLNAVVSHPQALAVLRKADVVRGDGHWLHLNTGWRLALAPAREWNPHPDYGSLARWPQVIARNLDWLRTYLPLAAPQASLAATHAGLTQGAFGSEPAVALVHSRASALTDGLVQAYQHGDLGHVTAWAGRLAGLGPGLTPAGDDWLAGWLVGLRVAAAMNDDELPLPVNTVSCAVIGGARTRTSRLSLAFLQAAADGAVAQPWHALLAALPDPNPSPIHHAAAEILRYGATSGSDMLAGFVAAFREGGVHRLQHCTPAPAAVGSRHGLAPIPARNDHHTMTNETSETPVSPNASVTLRPITDDNLRAILRLKVAPQQEQFVASNPVSLAQAHFNKYAWYRAIYADDTPVGFMMLYDDPVKPEYFLWRLMVDARYQGNGFAWQAVQQLIDYARSRPGAKELLVSHGQGEGSPAAFYARVGFQYTGEEDDGELIMRLSLEPSTGISAGRVAQRIETPQPLTHVVLFKLKDRSAEAVEETAHVLRSMDGRIAPLQAIEVGVNVVPSPRAYDIALITRFASLADMELYQAHPIHQDVLAHIREVMEGAVAVDFESSEP